MRILIIALLLTMGAAQADTIAVIGTGNVGMALGTEFATQGHTIIYGSRDPDGLKAQDLVGKTSGDASAALPEEAAREASIVVLAVPGMAVGEVVEGLGDLDGKIVIDVTNPLKRTAALQFAHGVETSNGEIVRKAAPGARVVKAFNTISWTHMIEPERAGGPLSVPLAGDDDEAKAVVAEFAARMGLEPIDIGGMEYARWLEMTVVVMLNNQFSNRDSFELYLQKTD